MEKEAAQLIEFLNAERLQQSRTIARQLDILGRQNRALEQMRLSRRPPKLSHEDQAARVLTLRLAAACERIERGGTNLTSSEIAGILALALNHLTGDVRVKNRRHRSVPCQAKESQRSRSHYSDGDEADGGLDIELLYYSSPQPASECGFSSTPLSPRATDPALHRLVGDYATTLNEFTELTVDSEDDQVLRGTWGSRPVSIHLSDSESLNAIFTDSGYKIPGKIKRKQIYWFGGQVWKPLSLGGKWNSGHCHVELDDRGVGVWGSRPISVSKNGRQISANFDSFTLRGQFTSPEELQWENGQVWRKIT